MSSLRTGDPEVWKQVALVSGLGFVLFASIGGGYLLGWLLDRKLGTSPIFAVIIAGVGLAGGLVEVLRVMKRAEREGGGDNHGSPQD